jgi:integrase
VQGNLQQRGPSSWRIRVFVGRDETGKKRYLERTVRGTKREAQRVMARLVTEVDDGRHVAAASTRFGEVLERWLEIKATVVEPTTIASYRWIANTYVAPALGSLPLDKIRVLDLDRFYARLRSSGSGTGAELSPRTVRLCHTVVSQTLDQARRWGLVARNVAPDATVPKSRKGEIVPPSVDTLRHLLVTAVAADAEFALYLRVLAATGCRRSEVLALRWTDVELATGELRIRRALAIVEGKVIEKDTKTHQARRIAIDPATLAALETHRMQIEDRALRLGLVSGVDGLVFSSDDHRQRPWRPDVVTNRFIRLCRKAGVSGVRLHDLRHFVATNLGAAGTPIATISARLGHRDVATTLNVYSHSLPAADRAAASTLGELLA